MLLDRPAALAGRSSAAQIRLCWPLCAFINYIHLLTSCVQRSIDVCSTKHHSTWRTGTSTPQTLLVASICRVTGNTVPQYMTDCCIHPHLRHCSSPASAGWLVTPYHSTWWTAASTPQTLLVASICRVAGNTLPQYMMDCCIHTADIARRQHLPGGR